MSRNELSHEIDRIARRERGRLVADLVRRLGSRHLDLAEDVAQDALLQAMSTWPYQGLPDRPAAWLYTVARNRAFDRLKRENRERPLGDELEGEPGANINAATIDDPELRLIFLCCHDSLGDLEMLTLTLKLVSGFTAREIGAALLAKNATIGQRLARAKRKLASLDASIADSPSRFDISRRLPFGLKTVYLMFSLGYAPRSGDALIRRDVAFEALRLARELADSDVTGTPDAQALAALLCLQASRFDAREDGTGNVVLLADQDPDAWDADLIATGLGYLERARAATRLSRYHFEAGIAAIHATARPPGSCDWVGIARLYDRLGSITQSPVVAVNACVAKAMAGDAATALTQLDALGSDPYLADYAPYYVARAEVLAQLGDAQAAAEVGRQAIECGVSIPVERFLADRYCSSL